MPATFSVPARLRRSWPPPLMSGSTDSAVAEHESADPFGSADLVGGEAQHIGAERGHIEPDPSCRLDGVGVEQPACAVDDL